MKALGDSDFPSELFTLTNRKNPINSVPGPKIG